LASHHYSDSATSDPIKRYASDLGDEEFDLIAPQVRQKDGSGKKRTVDIREVLNAIFYRTRTGCQWRMLPSDFPAWYYVWYYYRKWRNDGTLERINTMLRREVRSRAGRDPEPSVGIMDSQSVETTEMGGERGFNPAKQVKGRKRHLMTDTLGLILFVVVCAASISDSDGAEYIFHETEGRFPRLHRPGGSRLQKLACGICQALVWHHGRYREPFTATARVRCTAAMLEDRADVWLAGLESHPQQGI
jgi:transposase